MINSDILALRKIKAISDYQFGQDITDILFDTDKGIKIERSRNTNRIRYIYYNDKLLLSLRPTNGFLTLTKHSASKIIKQSTIPRLRVVVLTEISEYIMKGRNVFCKHVVDIDNNLRPMDEVIVVNQEDQILAIGRLKIPAQQVKFFESGIAILVRKGFDK
jgi:predicted RNA-binding protein (TIGR00451 family)